MRVGYQGWVVNDLQVANDRTGALYEDNDPSRQLAADGIR